MPAHSEWLHAAPLVIAHRGASAAAPENTLPAFERAAADGAEAVELDAKLTADGRVIAFHDPTLERTTGAAGRPGDATLQDLRRLDAGVWKGPAFRGTTIPTLEEIFEAVGRRLLINIELTEYRRPQGPLVQAVIALVRRHDLSRRVLLSSFQAAALRHARRLAPEIPLAYLRGPTWLSLFDLADVRRRQVEAFHVHISLLALWSAARRRSRRLHVYTVDDPDTLRRLWTIGVDGVITNQPALARQLRDEG